MLSKNPSLNYKSDLRPVSVQAGEVLRVRIQNISQENENYAVRGRSRRVNFEPAQSLDVNLSPGESTTLTFKPVPKSQPIIGGEVWYPFRIQIEAGEGEVQILKGEVGQKGKISLLFAILALFVPVILFFLVLSTRPTPVLGMKKTVFRQTVIVGTPAQMDSEVILDVLPIKATPTSPPPHAGDVLYLSFDDGPSVQWTPQILAILAKYNAKATFFIVGKYAKEHAEIVHAVVDAGHIIAHHTWSHSSLAGLGFDVFSEEIYLTNLAVAQDVAPCVRLPYAEADAYTESYAAELGLEIVWWDVDPLDWSSPGQENIIDAVLKDVSPDDIILLHDGGGNRSQTLGALEKILEELSAQGYKFGLLCVD